MKINLWIIGGLGNNLFQLVTYFKLLDEGYNVKILDTLTKKNFITKKLGWRIHEPIFLYFFPKNCLINQNHFRSILILIFFIANRNINVFSKTAFFYKENNYIKNSKNIIGYFQDKDFLTSNSKSLLKVIDLIRKKTIDANFSNKIVVHFRGKDSNNLFNNINLLKEIINIESKNNITIVTDDINKLKPLINYSSIKIVSDSIINDFKYLVNTTEKLYCSDSTFSWWASQCVSKDCKVYIPKKLYDNHGHYGTSKFELI